MHSSRKFKAFLSFNWQWYIVILLTVILMFYYVFMTLRTPGFDEKIQVFIAASYVETDKLETALYDGFEQTPIKEVSVDFSNPKGTDFGIVFNTRGTVNTDIIIINSNYIKEGDYDRFFVGFTEDKIANLVPSDAEYLYDQDGLIYGICVNHYLDEYLKSNDEKLYLFFNKQSGKIGELSQNSENNYALTVLKNMFRGMMSDEENQG